MDFLAGFTIFLIALIMVINLVPGILVGIQSQRIDYDAVAYRTAVILLEDPGWGYDRNLNTSTTHWEQQLAFTSDVSRFGLAVSKETPNILSRNKIETFFTSGLFTRDDYERKAVFADLPYAPYGYRIALAIDGEGTKSTGDTVPEVSYGYMRRFVKVKDYTSATLPAAPYVASVPITNTTGLNHTTYLAVVLNYTELNEPVISDAFRINPQSDNVTVTLTGLTEALQATANFTDIQQVTLTGVTLSKWDLATSPPRWVNQTIFLRDYVLYNQTPAQVQDGGVAFPVRNTTTLGLELLPPLPFAEDPNAVISINFTFRYDWASATNAENQHNFVFDNDVFAYSPATVTVPALKNGVVEVAIW
ncbi:MAG: hypothetical protein GKC04_07200 [Methanomicrobiales archaeon]|nr:hypothetical protein [Methanomicrobiales archaeon]